MCLKLMINREVLSRDHILSDGKLKWKFIQWLIMPMILGSLYTASTWKNNIQKLLANFMLNKFQMNLNQISHYDLMLRTIVHVAPIGIYTKSVTT